ncbi:hypothetical protein AYI68_g2772 [Smittium mucronatum]|uniref:DUF4604 domain-containing protein n=1 Tax=Smittium mucronatum TaxID=133383 RepID=A0A1R0H1T3_9FUNG|nr:hypothetical protein AYI68_g2772 [Smittium mucronatum]
MSKRNNRNLEYTSTTPKFLQRMLQNVPEEPTIKSKFQDDQPENLVDHTEELDSSQIANIETSGISSIEIENFLKRKNDTPKNKKVDCDSKILYHKPDPNKKIKVFGKDLESKDSERKKSKSGDNIVKTSISEKKKKVQRQKKNTNLLSFE